MIRFVRAAASAALILATFAVIFASGYRRVAAQTAPPAPASSQAPTEPPAATPTPAPPRRRGLFHRRSKAPAAPSAGTETAAPTAAPEPNATPTSPAFSTLDGSWEVERQYSNATSYSYFTIIQTGTALAGNWRMAGKSYPLAGSYDGHNIQLVATLPDGDVSFTGYVLNGADMVGLLVPKSKGADAETAFTAEHRTKDKGVLDIGPGGAGVPGSGLPGGGLPGGGPSGRGY